MSSPNDFWQIIDGHKLKLLYKAGVSWLSQHVDAINRMNVFPVPPGCSMCAYVTTRLFIDEFLDHYLILID